MSKQDVFGAEDNMEVGPMRPTGVYPPKLEALMGELKTSFKRLHNKKKEVEKEKMQYDNLLEEVLRTERPASDEKKVQKYRLKLEKKTNVPFHVILEFFCNKLENDAMFRQGLINFARMTRKRKIERYLAENLQDEETDGEKSEKRKVIGDCPQRTQ